nr:MAG TPA: hypothetical protein [Caudoviricetes sp.]
MLLYHNVVYLHCDNETTIKTHKISEAVFKKYDFCLVV